MSNIFSMEINPSITLPKGYFVATSGSSKGDLVQVAKLLTKLEKANIVLSSKAINTLMTLDELTFKVISHDLLLQFKPVQGQFLRSSFASGNDVADEAMTLDDYIIQFNHYFITYGLGQIDESIFVTPKGRKVEIENLTKKKVTKELNCTFRIIDIKSQTEFIQEVAKVVTMPIVFGAQQTEFIQEAFDKNLLELVFEDVQSIKVKENIFAILSITGKEFFKSSGILKTATDILRYAYFVSGEDYKTLETSVKFKLKTSDKKVIMQALNTIASKDIKNTFGDMKPNKSQWLSVSKNLFPGSSKFNNFKNAQGVFDFLRNNGKVETFNTLTQAFIKDKNFSGLAVHLAAKPGELLRSLDMIIRNSDKSEIAYLVDIVKDIKLNPKLVIQVRKWLSYRTEHAMTERTFKVKGKPKTIDNKPLAELKTKRTMLVVEALRNIMVKHLEGKDLFSAQLKEIVAYEDAKIAEEIEIARAI